MPPGGSFHYEVRFPDAGLYWYHPHHREDLLQDAGLAGNILVRPGDPGWLGPADREEVLLLDDLLADGLGLLPWGEETPTHALMGRFGNILLVNGEPRWDAEVDRGAVVRLWLTNASNTRTWNLSLPGARMKAVATDLGRFDTEAWVESVVLGPAERYAVDVRFGRAGAVPLIGLWLVALGLGAGHAIQPGHGKTLVAATVVGERGGWGWGVVLALVTTAASAGPPQPGFATFAGQADGDQFGTTITCGDVNRDRYEEIVISAPFADPGGLSEAGRVYVFSGKDQSLLKQLDGQAGGDHFGHSLACWDVNGDRYSDLIVGAPYASPNGMAAAGDAHLTGG